MKMINRITQTLLDSALSARLIICLVLLAAVHISYASTPYNGTPMVIPGTIEVEDYDLGGAGDAYSDTTAGNTGTAYRSDDVDIEGGPSEFNVGWTAPGEWLKYTVNVASNGIYTMTARVASAVASGAFHLEVNDIDVTESIEVGSTGGWQTWLEVSTNITLSAGQQVITLGIDGADLNIDRIELTYVGPLPASPTGLMVDSTGSNTVSLSWTAASGSPTGYKVKRAATSNGTYAVVGTTTAPTVSFTDSVTGGSSYYYVVSALTVDGESADSSYVSAMPALGVPDAPSDLVATGSDSQVVLSWAAPAVGSPASYTVKRSITDGSGYTAITTPGAQTTTSYTDVMATNGTMYFYVVSAENAVGTSSNSSQVSATPVAYAGAYESFDYPVNDNLLSGTASTGDGFGTWDSIPAGWVLDGLSYPDLPVANQAMRTPAGRQTVDLDVPISSGTKWISYLWSHSAGDPGGNKNGVYFLNGGTGLYLGVGYPYSATDGTFGLASINTVGTAVDGAPTLLASTAQAYPYGGTKLIVLKIEFNTDGNNDTVTVYVNPTANQSSPGVDAAAVYSAFDVGTISGIGMQVAGGGDFITDEFRFAETYAEVVDAVTEAPDVPTDLMVTSGSNLVSLSWTAAEGVPTGYNVKRSTVPGGPYTIIGTTTEPTVTYEDEVLGGQTYYYVVSAVNGIGESADITYVPADPILAPPVTPVGFSATEGDAQVSLGWSASAFATLYDVQRASEPAGPYTSIGTTGALTYDDSTVANSVTYYYVVTAVGVGGTSAATLPVSATPFGPVPLVLDMHHGIGITWYASNSVTYRVQWTAEELGTNTVWTDLGVPILGDDSTHTVVDPVDEGRSQYRVISIQ